MLISVFLIWLFKYRLHKLGTLTFLFWQTLTCSLASFGMMATTIETPTLPRIKICVIFLLVHMVLSGTHSMFTIYGYKFAVPTITGLLQTIQIPTSFVLQFTVLSGLYPGNANIVGIIGAIVVVIGNALVPTIETIRYLISSK